MADASVAGRWRAAARAALRLHRAEQERAGPWVDPAIPPERCVRHDYDALTGLWSTSETMCRLATSSFAEGAMRRCFRMLKESQAPGLDEEQRHDWSRSSAYVAKEYKDGAVGRAAYERDVMAQQEAKLWGERYDALHPPKAVDFLQAFLITLPDRPRGPVYACERMIGGEYIKHNSNSGYVEHGEGAGHSRATPQAFSHFSFVASGGKVMVVDMQGVSDLYTDPQLHTLDGKGYGEGNLGAHGMALFFAAHHCSPLCAKLGLPPLPRTAVEEDRLALSSSSSSAVEATGRVMAVSSAPDLNGSLAAALHNMRLSLSATLTSATAREAAERARKCRERDRNIVSVSLDVLPPWASLPETWAAVTLPPPPPPPHLTRRLSMLERVADAHASPEALFAPVHLALARSNACGGLPDLDGTPDEAAAVFHAFYAARGGEALAVQAVRDLCRGVVQDLVPGVRLAAELPAVAVALTGVLARGGDPAACLEVAETCADAAQRLAWLEKALTAPPAEGCARHELLAKLGHARLVCGQRAAAAEAFGEAAEAAAAAGKVKLSMSLAELAEQAGEE